MARMKWIRIAIFPILMIIAPSIQMVFGDPIHCHGYGCYSIGYTDAKNGNSPAYACVGHTEVWCAGYNNGFCAGNGGSNIFYGQRSDQNANVNVDGDNNKISINQEISNQI